MAYRPVPVLRRQLPRGDHPLPGDLRGRADVMTHEGRPGRGAGARRPGRHDHARHAHRRRRPADGLRRPDDATASARSRACMVNYVAADEADARRVFDALAEGGAGHAAARADVLVARVRHVRRPLRHALDGLRPPAATATTVLTPADRRAPPHPSVSCSECFVQVAPARKHSDAADTRMPSPPTHRSSVTASAPVRSECEKAVGPCPDFFRK